MRNDKELIKRIEALNRKPLLNTAEKSIDAETKNQLVKKIKKTDKSNQTIFHPRDIPRIPPNTKHDIGTSKPAILLEEAIDGTEIIAPTGKSAYKIDIRLVEHDGKLRKVSSIFGNELMRPESPLRNRLRDRYLIDELNPDDVIFLDLETTGLSNSPVFLVGLLLWEDDGLVVRQFFARNYAEEAAIASLFIEHMRNKQLLITFNGKSFDFPYMRSRSAANGIPFIQEPIHLDMLHECRRIYKSRLPDCKLQTLERSVCGTTRSGDIPGCEIPDAYHDYVRTSNAEKIVQILKHNAMDLVTLADLLVRLPSS